MMRAIGILGLLIVSSNLRKLAVPLSQLSSEQLEQAKAEFEAELEALVTAQGIWNDKTTFFVLGRKQLSVSR
jgi:hypothetical protein